MTTVKDLRFVKVEPGSWQHTVADKRKPTKYAVYLNDELIGYVHTHSEENWRKAGRIRTSLIGFSRSWTSLDATGANIDRFHYNRTYAAEAVLRAHEGKRR